MTNPYINNQNTDKSAINETINNLTKDIPFIPDNFNTAGFLKGVLLGAGITYLLTNQNA